MNETQPTANDRITLIEAADLLRCSVQTVRRYTRTGLLVPYRRGPKMLYVSRVECLALFQAIEEVGPAVARVARPRTSRGHEEAMAFLRSINCT